MGKLLEELSRSSMAAQPALPSHTGYIQHITSALHMMTMKDKRCAFHILCFSNKAALGKIFCPSDLFGIFTSLFPVTCIA